MPQGDFRNASGLTVREPQSDADWKQYFDLRWRVLRAPWQQPRGSETDDREADSLHLMLSDASGAPLAVGRLHLNSPDEAQIRFMAVEPGAERQGLGGRVLAALEARAASLGMQRIVLNARDQAIPFYQKHRYAVIGEAATLFGRVAHVKMQKKL